MPPSLRFLAWLVLLGASAGARAQVPDALRGTWDSADSTEQVFEVGDEDPVVQTILYQATTFTDSEIVWTTVWRWEHMLMAWREVVGVRVEDDRLVMADSLDTRYALAGDTLTVAYEQPDGTVVTTALQRAATPKTPAGLLGTWSAGVVNDGAGIMVEIGMRFLPGGKVQVVSDHALPRRYAVVGSFLLLWDEIPPERAAQGEIRSYEAFRMALSGDRMELSSPVETLRMRRVPE